jgi:hypothetical protein
MSVTDIEAIPVAMDVQPREEGLGVEVDVDAVEQYRAD